MNVDQTAGNRLNCNHRIGTIMSDSSNCMKSMNLNLLSYCG